MYHHKTSYKSLADYDLDMMLQQRKKLAQVQSVLSLYDRNNQHLVDQVHLLIQQNQSLRNQIRHSSPKRLKQSSFTHKSSISQINSSLEAEKSTLKKQKSSRYLNKYSHPRNVYMAPIQVQMLNRKIMQQARTAQKKYDVSKGYEDFKQKLSERKEQLKKQYRQKSSFKNSQVSFNKNQYVQDYTSQFHKRQPLNQVNRVSFNIPLSHQQKKIIEKREPSPYENLQTSTVYRSPEKYDYSARSKRLDTQRSSSAIKVESAYPAVNIKISEPKTKWGGLSSTYLQKSKYLKSDENSNPLSEKQDTIQKSQNSKIHKKKRFLQIISQSIEIKSGQKNGEVKLIQKGQR